MKFGIQCFDDIMNLNKGEITFIGSRPTVGKINLSYEIVRNNFHFKTGYISYQYDEDTIKDRIGNNSYNLFIKCHPNIRLNDIISLIKDNEFDLLVIDYIQLLAEIEHKRVLTVLRLLKNIAIEYNVAIVILSQLSRKTESRVSRKPSFYDITFYNELIKISNNNILLYTRNPMIYLSRLTAIINFDGNEIDTPVFTDITAKLSNSLPTINVYEDKFMDLNNNIDQKFLHKCLNQFVFLRVKDNTSVIEHICKLLNYDDKMIKVESHEAEFDFKISDIKGMDIINIDDKPNLNFNLNDTYIYFKNIVKLKNIYGYEIDVLLLDIDFNNNCYDEVEFIYKYLDNGNICIGTTTYPKYLLKSINYY